MRYNKLFFICTGLFLYSGLNSLGMQSSFDSRSSKNRYARLRSCRSVNKNGNVVNRSGQERGSDTCAARRSDEEAMNAEEKENKDG